MKDIFIKPSIEIISLNDNDVIVTSLPENGFPLEDEEW